MNKKTNILLWASGILTVAITLVMNIVLMPQIEKATEGIRCFDMNSFGYSFETAQKFLSLIDENGRNVYLDIQLPLDFFYPIVYTIFFSLMIFKFGKNIKKRNFFFVFPALLFLCDYCENICSVIMLKSEELQPFLAHFASTTTILKTFFMYLTIIIALIFIVLSIIRSKKAK